MSEEKRDSPQEALGQQVEVAERRLREAVEAAAAAEQRASAEIEALEADLEKERQGNAEALEDLRRRHAAELAGEREAKEAAIAAAERRLAEIEQQAEAAEQRIEEARRQAGDVAGTGADVEARAREAAAAWLRGQIEALRREAAGR